MEAMTYDPKAQRKRYTKSEAELISAGGKRINIRLRPEGAKKLRRLMKEAGVDQTEAIHLALAMAP